MNWYTIPLVLVAYEVGKSLSSCFFTGRRRTKAKGHGVLR